MKVVERVPPPADNPAVSESTGASRTAISSIYSSGTLYSSGTPGEEPTRFEQLLYRDLVIEGRTVLEVASLYGIGSTDAIRSRERVEAWLAENMPTTHLSLDEQRTMIQKVTIDRLEYLYAEVMGAWRDSRNDVSVTTRPTFQAVENTTTTTSSARPRGSLITVAARLVTLMDKTQRDWVADKERRAASNHLLRDCSEFRGEAGSASAGPARVIDASSSAAIEYDRSGSAVAPPPGSLNDRTRPVQPPGQGGVPSGPALAGQPAKSSPKAPEKPPPIVMDSIIMPGRW
jgi:hypothetical protein